MGGDTPGLERRFSAAGARAHRPRTDGTVPAFILAENMHGLWRRLTPQGHDRAKATRELCDKIRRLCGVFSHGWGVDYLVVEGGAILVAEPLLDLEGTGTPRELSNNPQNQQLQFLALKGH
jgi:hypothetical protein